MAKKRSKGDDLVVGRFGVMATFKFILKNAGLFLPLLVVALLVCALSLITSEDAMIIIIVVAMLILWLTSLFFARRVMAGEKVRFRDGLYNAMTPLVSSLMVFIVLVIQCIPIMLLIIAYSAAIETNLFGDMFYGSLFVLFAILMVALSVYLVSGTLMGLIAVSTPGMYPIEALKLSHELMVGRRLEFALRLLVMVMMVVGIFVVIVGPAVLISLAFYNIGGIEMPMLVPIATTVAGCFAVTQSAVYLYIYYRKTLGMDVTLGKKK